ncbi:hypothetical protein [Streptomyces anthocyanicus]|uniref:hypothetical protein n=1 Tax=Streptomyces anthocyanicus TaxID=68174 RepID=UPI00381D365E
MSGPKTEAADSISDAERELYGGRLRYDQSYARHEGPLTRLKFGHMAAALPHMVGMVRHPTAFPAPAASSRPATRRRADPPT